jgi:PAS domain S-box-containing protein
VDLDGMILFCNQRFCDLMKAPIHGTMGHKMSTFAARPQQSFLQALLAAAQAGPAQQRVTLRATDGTAVPVQLAASPLQAGGSLSICLVASDLTELEESAHSLRVLREHEQAMQEANERLQIQAEELRAAEAALRELNATLEARVAQRTAELRYRARQLQKLTLEMSEAEDRERKRMAEILHDDLQQQLAAAKFHLSLVRSRIKHDPATQAMTTEIDQMLKDAIEKSRSLSHELSPAVLHLDDFAETLRWLANDVQAKHGLVVHVQGQMPLESDALKVFLYKTAQELVFNVVKHARVREAKIRVRRWRQYLCLAVSDRGRGFDPQGLREAAGFGLLSICERIELLGGRMRIKSAVGRGSTFFLTLPDGEVAATGLVAQERSRGQAKDGERAAATDRLRVLLADDHEIVRQGLTALLQEEHSIEIVGEAANGREAVNLADRLEPDVVIMDVSMPLMDGYEATRQIKAHLPQMRIVALSMYNEPEAMENMYRAGAESYVLKTAPFDDLLAAIRGEAQPHSAVPCGSTL